MKRTSKRIGANPEGESGPGGPPSEMGWSAFT